MEELHSFVAAAQGRAFHLEMRDTYPNDESYLRWASGNEYDPRRGADWWAITTDLLTRGIDMRRLRVFSEPMADYIRYEWESWSKAPIIREPLRWLPRQLASDLRFPGNDHWLVDDVLLFLTFTGDGETLGSERRDEPELVEFCAASFEAAWNRGVDHSDYKPILNDQ